MIFRQKPLNVKYKYKDRELTYKVVDLNNNIALGPFRHIELEVENYMTILTDHVNQMRNSIGLNIVSVTEDDTE